MSDVEPLAAEDKAALVRDYSERGMSCVGTYIEGGVLKQRRVVISNVRFEPRETDRQAD